MVSLVSIKVGEKAEICDFINSAAKCFSSRFGIEKGQVVTCIAKPGAVVIRKNNQEIALGKRLCEEIFVNIR